MAKDFGAKAVIAIGGGSAIDTGKKRCNFNGIRK